MYFAVVNLIVFDGINLKWLWIIQYKTIIQINICCL